MRQRLYETLSVALPAILLVATVARAEPTTPDLFGRPTKPAALKEMRTGNTLYKQGEFERAIDFYKSGQLIQDSPLFLFNIGQCYRQLGDYEKAIWFYERWLSAFNPPPDNPARQAVEKWIPQMRAELEQKARSAPPLEAAPDTGSVSSANDTDEVTGSRSLGLAKPPPATDSPSWYSDGLGWGITGAGVGLIAAGGGLLANAASVDEDADREPNEPARRDLLDQADRRRITGAVLLSTGAVGLVSGIVRLARSPAPRSKNVNVAVGAGWLSLRGVF